MTFTLLRTGLVLAALFFLAPTDLKAQSYTLSNGEVLTYDTTGPTLSSASGDNASTFTVILNGRNVTVNTGEAGGLAGTVNLLTSGYNGVSMSGFSVDNGWMAALPLSPAQVAANTSLFIQKYSSTSVVNNALQSFTGTAYNFKSGATTFTTWFRSGQSRTKPAAPFALLDTPTATLLWSGGQLHLTDGISDVIVPVPADWDGTVAIINMAQQNGNGDDGWFNEAYYVTASIGPPPPPSGVITTSSDQVQAKGKVDVTWHLN